MNAIERLRKECSYDPEAEGSVDDLIAYKDALEDAYAIDAEALDELNLLLSAPEWPGASGMEDVLGIVRRTGRTEVPNAPVWERH